MKLSLVDIHSQGERKAHGFFRPPREMSLKFANPIKGTRIEEIGHYNSLVAALDKLLGMGVISKNQKNKALRLKNINRGNSGILVGDE